MTREQAVRWCMERGYCFVELDRGDEMSLRQFIADVMELTEIVGIM